MTDHPQELREFANRLFAEDDDPVTNFIPTRDSEPAEVDPALREFANRLFDPTDH